MIKQIITSGCLLTLALTSLMATGAAETKTASSDPVSGLKWILVKDLPKEAKDVLGVIQKGGPFRYERDGIPFGNYERILPIKNRGYYREYTVPTPGERTRGARRLVCGGQPITNIKECYYTSDHYKSFRRVK